MNKFLQKSGKGILLFLLSLLTVLPFQKTVKHFVGRILPETSVSVKVLADETTGEYKPVVFYKDGNEKDLFDILYQASDSKWSYYEGEKGKSWTVLRSCEPGAEITFSMKADDSRYILFEKNGRNGYAEIVVGNGKIIANAYTDSGTTELLKIYPFTQYILSVQIWINIVLVFIFSILFYLLSIRRGKSLEKSTVQEG